MTTEAERRVLSGGGQSGCVLCEDAARRLGVTLPAPLWPCLSCGARNRLRDTTCRHCGDPKPEAHS